MMRSIATTDADSAVLLDASGDLANITRLIDPHLWAAVANLDGSAPMLAGMARYHLGAVDETLTPVAPPLDRGKGMRPAIALLSCAASGGSVAMAAPLGAAIELLHNFSLIHDDVQDESPTRRHRPTVWSLWGVGQAINAGDSLFAAAHLALHRLVQESVPGETVLRLLEAFDRTTIRIVEGQTLDLSFEGRSDVTTTDYWTMIEGKTAAIVEYAAWSGALTSGCDDITATRFGAFGRAVGLGFQIQDDLLGIWGTSDRTGKPAADDIRRRKQSLPILLLRERLDSDGRRELDRLYSQSTIESPGITRILDLLEITRVRSSIEAAVARHHDDARQLLQSAATSNPNPGRDQLMRLLSRLAERLG